MQTKAIIVLFLSLTLAGCATGPSSLSSPETGLALKGKVHGGQQPIVGAHVYLMAANTTGYGGSGITPSANNASISLLTSATGNSDSIGNYVLTGSDGSFSITGDYTCTTGQQVYLYALGGNPGAGTNSAASLMAILGSCPGTTFSANTSIWINEVSTIAAAYAMAGFASDSTHVSSSGTTLAKQGIATAFAAAANLETLATGVALSTTPGGNGTAPQKAINTLANIVTTCVNSTGAGSSSCSTLFNNAPSLTSPATLPSDTATAAINIAHSPGTSVAALYGLSTPALAFAPALTAQPNDFTVGINFTGGGLGSTNNIAIDGSGNVWVANYGSADISKFSPLGVAISPSAGYTGGGMNEPWAVAIDQSGEVWTGNYVNVVSNFTNSGVAISSGDTGGGLNYPFSIAIDGSGFVWIGNYGNAVSKFSSAGAAISSSSGYTGGGLNVSQSIAIDGSGYVWLANANGNSLSKFTSGGAAVTTSAGYTGGGLIYPLGMAIDSAGNVWASNINGNTLSKFSNNGVAISPSGGYSGGGLSHNKTLSIDGAGNVFTANVNNNSISMFSSAGAALSPSTGFTGGTLNGPDAVAVDGSGNAWIANGANSITELVGIAAPVITPICVGLPSTPTANGTSNLGTRP